MGYLIKCTKGCKDVSWALNIVELLKLRDERGLFRCACGHKGYIQKSFDLQEKGEHWEPFLRGAIVLGRPGETYQPFVYLVSEKPDGKIDDLWFAYYKDMRSDGGRLKLGYGPGGPPVLSTDQVRVLLKKVEELGGSESQIPQLDVLPANEEAA